MTPEPDFISLSRRFAALSGPFHPRAAIEASQVDPASPEALDLTADLASACEIQKDPESGVRWLMRTSARSWELQALGPDGRAAAAAWRREQPAFDGPAQDIVMALAGEGGFAPDVIEARLLAIENGEPAQVLELERLTCALEWAGPAGPAFRLLDRVRAAVDRQHEAQRGESLLQAGFLGREAERKRLVDWIARPIPQGRVTALFVTGLPAIGKSTLLEQAIRDAAASQGPALVIRLDFDRAGLDVRDQVGLTMEVSRQLAAQLPQQAHEMRTARLVAAAVDDEETKGDRRDRIPPALASAMAQDLQASGRPILFLLDTLEALLSRGASHIQQLFGWLDVLLSYGLAPMSVIAAGRGEALAPARERIFGPPVELDALTPEDGLALLGRLGVPKELHDRIQTQAQGNPLRLRLSAAFATGADANGEPPADLTDEAHLYRALKSRIVQPELAALVEPGLLLRRINAEALGEVMTVAAGQPRVEAQAAQALFEALIAHQWLMQPDPDAPGWWRQVPAMRTVLFPRLAKGRRARRLHALARDWFAKRPRALGSGGKPLSSAAGPAGQGPAAQPGAGGSVRPADDRRTAPGGPRRRGLGAGREFLPTAGRRPRPRHPAPASIRGRRPICSSRSNAPTGSRAATCTIGRSRTSMWTLCRRSPTPRARCCGGWDAGSRRARRCGSTTSNCQVTATSKRCRPKWRSPAPRCAPSSIPKGCGGGCEPTLDTARRWSASSSAAARARRRDRR
jgi:hypothetical protein